MPGVRLIQDRFAGNTPAVFRRFNAPGAHHSMRVNPSQHQVRKTVSKNDRTEDSKPDDFGALMYRFMSAMQRMRLAAHAFEDNTPPGTPEEHVSAAWVVDEVERELKQLYNDFDLWNMDHDCTPKAPKGVQPSKALK